MENYKLDYQDLIKKYPWIVEKDQNCIVSPDSDGLLCGLLMSHYLKWKIKGFYDAKVLVIDKDVTPEDCVFLDVDIFRKEIKSVGHHMVAFRNDNPPPNWGNFNNCIQPNNIRGFDFKNKFSEKYPLATIHLLISILKSKLKIEIKEEAEGILLYTDGTFKNIFNYPENCLSWFDYLGISEENNPIHPIFYSQKNYIMKIMENLRDFFGQLSAMNDGKRGADKIVLTKKNRKRGIEIVGLDKTGDSFQLKPKTRQLAEGFLKILSNLTGWNYNDGLWQFDNFSVKKFTKDSIPPTQARYYNLLAQNPISFAITSGQSLEYTLENTDTLLTK